MFIDLISYRIPNSLVLVGLLLIWPYLFLVGLKFQISLPSITLTAVSLILGWVSLIGMGDAKLFLLAAPWLHYDNLSKALVMMIAVSWVQLLVGSALKGRVLHRIAFAPAILSAVLLNLAT
jgi:Flp pilus assembly protein protease CpaA